MTVRAFGTHELAARLWWTLSRFPRERAIAARRFRETAPACADDNLRLHVVGLLALEGFHAIGITAPIVRDRSEWLVRFGGAEDFEIVTLGVALVDDMIAATARALRMRAAAR